MGDILGKEKTGGGGGLGKRAPMTFTIRWA